jgi:hypothetical protein
MWKPPGGGGEKWFCGECGSALFGSNPSHPEPVGIRMGTFDDDPGIRPTVRQFVAYAAAWQPLRSPTTACQGSSKAVTLPMRARSDRRRAAHPAHRAR